MALSLSSFSSLSSLSVDSKTFFETSPLICDEFPIQIRSLTGKETPIKVHHKMIVSELKEMIEKIDQTPFDQQRLVYNGKQLEDERTLDYYNIQKDTVVHIILRIRGGMFHETSARKDYGLVQLTTSDINSGKCIVLTIEELEEKNSHSKN
jgi:hypothetical protein